MELRHLEYFVAVATELNFSRAAQRVNVVQSALSVAIAKLEKELGVELFDRSRRQIELTAAGSTFLEHARAVIHTAQRARQSVHDYRDQITGTVTLGILMSWGALDLAGILDAFRQHNPLVAVHLRQSHGGSVGHLTQIANGHMDLALVSVAAPPSSRVVLHELTHEPMVFVCHRGHTLAGRADIHIGDLADEDIIQFPHGWGIRQRLDAAFATANTVPLSTYEVADYAIAADLIRHRLTTAVLPINAARRFPDLRAIQLNPTMTWTLSMASAADQYRSAAATALMRHFTDHIANQ